MARDRLIRLIVGLLLPPLLGGVISILWIVLQTTLTGESPFAGGSVTTNLLLVLRVFQISFADQTVNMVIYALLMEFVVRRLLDNGGPFAGLAYLGTSTMLGVVAALTGLLGGNPQAKAALGAVVGWITGLILLKIRPTQAEAGSA